jgi:hypothetical protein
MELCIKNQDDYFEHLIKKLSLKVHSSSFYLKLFELFVRPKYLKN